MQRYDLKSNKTNFFIVEAKKKRFYSADLASLPADFISVL